MNNNPHDLSEKSDDWLVEALRSDHKYEHSAALEELYNRYASQVENYARRFVEWHGWIRPEDIVHETFLDFLKYIKVRQIKKGVRNLLMGIAHNKCVSALRRQTSDRKLENNIPLKEEMDGAVALEREEEIQQAREQIRELLQFLHQPYSAPLKGCPRAVWALRMLYGYKTELVSRLLAKSKATIHTHFSVANKSVKEYRSSDDFKLELAYQEMHEAEYRTSNHKFSLFVERFAEPVVPDFTPDELKPLGLTKDEFKANFVVSLLLPFCHQVDVYGRLHLLLTDRADWVRMQKGIKHLNRSHDEKASYSAHVLVPDEHVIAVDVEDGHMSLTPQYWTQVLLAFDRFKRARESTAEYSKGLVKEEPKVASSVYVSVHRPELTLPVDELLGYIQFDYPAEADEFERTELYPTSGTEDELPGVEFAPGELHTYPGFSYFPATQDKEPFIRTFKRAYGWVGRPIFLKGMRKNI